jgi:hypothetical protein
MDLNDLERHFWQAVYDDGTVISEIDGLVRFCDLDWDRVVRFGWIPRHDSAIQTAIIVERLPGYRVFARKEGALQLVRGGDRLITRQKEYAYHLGLFVDDGSEYAREVERGLATTVKHIDWAGGFCVFLPPDGQLQACGDFAVREELIEEAGRSVQLLIFSGSTGGDS